ncbi:MAG: hypothetical protein JWP75_310 [Frondihabitans sp.]|nr:hypothetical protein [Frondihabitans sp.]
MQTRTQSAPPALIRLVPELRACHLERHAQGTPARLLFLETNSDFDDTRALPAGVEKVSLVGAVRIIVSAPASHVELPEPLWMRFLPRHALLSAAALVGRPLRRRGRQIGTYAMENNEFGRLIGGRHDLPKPVIALAGVIIGAYTRLIFTRIAFASESSQRLYLSLPFVSKVESAVVDELPEALPGDDASVARHSAAFVGVLDERKGLRHLLRAWEAVERHLPDVILSISGSGPLGDEIRAWVAESPRSRLLVGRQSRDAVLARLEHTAVLIAPSVPDGRWREQIGLPIKEGLSRGLTIVTTEQTGLAPWLAASGHHVVALARPAVFEAELATALIAALERPLSRSAVRASLPRVDGRLRSDAWLNSSPAQAPSENRNPR